MVPALASWPSLLIHWRLRTPLLMTMPFSTVPHPTVSLCPRPGHAVRGSHWLGCSLRIAKMWALIKVQAEQQQQGAERRVTHLLFVLVCMCICVCVDPWQRRWTAGRRSQHRRSASRSGPAPRVPRRASRRRRTRQRWLPTAGRRESLRQFLRRPAGCRCSLMPFLCCSLTAPREQPTHRPRGLSFGGGM